MSSEKELYQMSIEELKQHHKSIEAQYPKLGNMLERIFMARTRFDLRALVTGRQWRYCGIVLREYGGEFSTPTIEVRWRGKIVYSGTYFGASILIPGVWIDLIKAEYNKVLIEEKIRMIDRMT